MQKEFTLKEIAERVGGSVEGDPRLIIKGIMPVEEAGDGYITFISDAKYLPKLKDSKASAVILSEQHRNADQRPRVVVKNPYLAYALCAQMFAETTVPIAGISSRAYIGENCEIDPTAAILPLASIGARVRIGARTVVHSGARIGDDCVIGESCVIHPNVTLYPGTQLGNRVIIHAGTVIGSDGFGYIRDEKEGRWAKIPQTGYVQIDDDVEIGANCAVDRGSMSRTWIKSGVKIDNIVQIGHNCVIGENCLIVSMTGLSGSVVLGRNVIVAAQAGVAQRVTVGDNSVLAGRSGVTKDLPAGSSVAGFPHMPHRRWQKCQAIFAKLPEFRDRLKELEKRLIKLEREKT